MAKNDLLLLCKLRSVDICTAGVHPQVHVAVSSVRFAQVAYHHPCFPRDCRSEYGTVWKSSAGLGGYIITQIVKLLFVASLITPPAPLDYAIDCLGLYYVLTKQKKASLPEVKILSKDTAN